MNPTGTTHVTPPGDLEAVAGRGALLGAMIAGGFGVAWSQWAAAGVSGAASGAIRIAGIAVGLAIVLVGARLRRESRRETRPASSRPWRKHSRGTFSARSYLVVVGIEILAIGAGNAILTATGLSDYVIAWTAVVVGMHFLAFGRLFFPGYYWLGAALIGSGIVGAVVGLSGGGLAATEVASGLMAAVSLFVAGGFTVLTAARRDPRMGRRS
jgi:hypothetical protein